MGDVASAHVFAHRVSRAAHIGAGVLLCLAASSALSQSEQGEARSSQKRARPEIILIDGINDGAIYSPSRAAQSGRFGTNVDDLYLALQKKPYMLGAEVRHAKWDRLDYIKARAPKVVIVGISAFAESSALKLNYTYSVHSLTSELVEPLAKTNVKFLVYYRSESNFDQGPGIATILCAAITTGCEHRVALVNAGPEVFPSPAFISNVNRELERLLK